MNENDNPKNHSSNLQDCDEWLEMGWWTPEEAWFAFLGLHPSLSADVTHRLTVMESPDGKRIKDLIDRAVVAWKITGLEREGGSYSGYYRASCHCWIAWAKTKKSISIDPILLQAVDRETSKQKSQVEGVKDFTERNFHSSIVKHAEKFYQERNFGNAVFEAAKAFEKAVKSKSGIEDFGEALMSKAFSLTKGPLKLNNNSSESERNEQEGVMHLAIGFIKAIKNPQSHEPVLDWPISKTDALDLLSFLSFLWRQLDKCQSIPKRQPIL